MQPTTKPTWLTWPGWDDGRREQPDRYHRRRMRLTLHDLRDLQLQAFLDWSHLPRQEIALYTPKQLRQLIRAENFNSELGVPFPTSDGSWRQDRYPLDTGPWSLSDLQHIRLETAPRDVSGAEAGRRGEGLARGWLAGAVLLAVLVLLVRAVEKCLHRKFLRSRRRSAEWPAANVLATSNQPPSDINIPSDGLHSENNQDVLNNDLPPPYSECATVSTVSGIGANKIYHEEPPPPYSACHVGFSNPKDGIPTVHFYNRRRENIFENNMEAGPSSDQNTGQNNSVTAGLNSDTVNIGCDQSDTNTELVFENGRIIEREGGVRRNEDNIPDETARNVEEIPQVRVEDSNADVVIPINAETIPDMVPV
ncbi:uncharacterized protein LOC131849937 [Achroia grisella]|uniref:uncharacterized protein LOC131849937 n=1 Tax=Achroia grisella TaxID=688607 RepID=UPI0027D27A7D|nr:uncharacterized protein LOC131849937 [Achroia grisella]